VDQNKISGTEMNSIVGHAKTTLNVTTEIRILKTKAFKAMTGSVQRGGTYNYFQDRVLVNRNIAERCTLPRLEWMIFHEYGHAYFARTFAKNSFFPMIVYATTVEDAIVENGVRHMWNGLCDCYVNELVFRKAGFRKFDPTLEETIDTIAEGLAAGMCFHLYDYWKHGVNEQVAQKAKEKIPPEIFNALQTGLSLTSLNNPKDPMVHALAFVGNKLFQIKVVTKTMSKREIEKSAGAALPEFWGDDNTNLELLEIT
jgi:hypothetical protein